MSCEMYFMYFLVYIVVYSVYSPPMGRSRSGFSLIVVDIVSGYYTGPRSIAV